MSPLPHDARNTAPAAKSSNTPSSTEQMLQMLAGYWAPQVVYAAARFGLADHLRGGGLTAEDFARAEGVDARAAHRFLRICASLGLTTVDRTARFHSTPLLETLRSDHPQALRDVALAQGAPGRRFAWSRFVEAARTLKREPGAALSSEFVNPVATSAPLEAKVFTQATGSLTEDVSHDIAQRLDTRAVDFVVDLGGGGGGSLLFALLRANPAMAGVVFDRPEGASAAKAAVQAAGLGERAAAVGGDVLQSVPDEGDLYLLNNVLHEWDDGECETILRNCRRAMRVGGRVVVVERLPEDIGETPMDMTMLNARERTLCDYRTLFTRVGLGNVRVTDTGTPMVILEAFALSDAWL